MRERGGGKAGWMREWDKEREGDGAAWNADWDEGERRGQGWMDVGVG